MYRSGSVAAADWAPCTRLARCSPTFGPHARTWHGGHRRSGPGTRLAQSRRWLAKPTLLLSARRGDYRVSYEIDDDRKVVVVHRVRRGRGTVLG